MTEVAPSNGTENKVIITKPIATLTSPKSAEM
jgi:hypothetical protein